jgi:Flp pilus assembly protein TadD
MDEKGFKKRFDSLFLEYPRPYLWIAFIGALVYIQALFFGFTYLDDNVLILDNLFFLGNIGNIFQTFKLEVFHVLHGSAAYYRPVLTISFMLDAQLAGAKPFLYHFSNIVVHLITTCLVYLFLTKLNYKKELVFLFSLLFVIHPVLVPAVSWIPGRNDSLLTLFILASFIFLDEYIKTKTPKFYLWHLVFFALAIFIKETAISLPIIYVLYIWLILRNKKVLSISAGFSLGWFFGIFLWFLLRSAALKNPVPYTLPNAIKSLSQNSPAVLLFLGKVLFPFNLNVLPTLEDSTLLYGVIAALVIFFSLVFSKNKRYNFLLFGGAWFIIFLTPSFIRPNPNYVADFFGHRLYLPLIGLIIVFLEIDFIKNLNLHNKRVIIGVFLLFLMMASINFIHARDFRNKIAFWENAVQASPRHPLAHRNLGAMYYLDGFYDKAEDEYWKSLEMNPNEPMVHNNLALIYMDKGLLDEAEVELKKELEINPYYDKAYFNYALLYHQKGELEKAAEMWLKTLQINPDHVDAYLNLAQYYYQKEDLVKANYYYNEAVKRGVRF